MAALIVAGWSAGSLVNRRVRREADLPVTSGLWLTLRLAGLAAVLAVVVLVAILGGGFGLYRAVRTQLEYARRRSDFVAAVSHELKTPLTTIRMYGEMLRDGMVPTSERQRAYHHTITMESDRLGRLIANVLELARLERGGARPVEVVGAVEPVRPLAWMIDHAVRRRGGLAQGQAITTGSWTGLRYFPPGTRARGEFPGLGSVEASF